ncbi:hypothetical protein Ancab_023355 [Ancistrocladus abbreviatus]
MKKLNLILNKCKSLSRQLARSSPHHSFRYSRSTDHSFRYSRSTRECRIEDEGDGEIVYVGSSRRRYVIKSKYLTHPLLNALIEKSRPSPGTDCISIKCEVVLFDHLLWMLESEDSNLNFESLEELADLYVL